MSWMNSAFYMLFLTSISGSAAFLLWLIWEKYLERKQCLKCICPLLIVVLLCFTVPFMYAGLKFSITDYKQGVMYGTLFEPTPFIYKVQCCVAGIWIVGVIINLGIYIKGYFRFRNIMKKNVLVQEQQTLKRRDRIQKNLRITKDIQIAINYGVKVPIVCGGFQKKIVLPVRSYTDEEVEIILYHEMTHIRQHILELKKIGSILKLIHWFNPMMREVLNKLDEWGETECDLSVLNNETFPFSKKQYFDVALAGLGELDIWLPQVTTQLKKEKTLKKRVKRMKNYKYEKGFKLAGGIIAGCLFLSFSGTVVYAMGEGFRALYEKVYAATVVEEKMELPQKEIIEEEYREDVTNVIVAEDAVWNDKIMMVDWNVLAKSLMIAEEAITLEKGDVMFVNIYTALEDKWIRVGILTPYGTKQYVENSGIESSFFEINTSGDYTVFMENIYSVGLAIEGSFVTN